MTIRINLDVMMAKRKIGVGELAEQIGITPANVSILKNGRAKAVRFTTWTPSARHSTANPETSSNGKMTIDRHATGSNSWFNL